MDVFGGNSPFSFARLSLKGVRSTAARRYGIPSVVVVGETLKDFCLYYGLSRLHGRALWLPDWFMPPADSFPSRMVTAIRKIDDMGRREHSQVLAVMSTSMDSSQLNELAGTMKKHVSLATLSTEDAADSDYIRTLVEHPLLWYVTKNAERITTHLLINNELPGTFESPVPSAFRHVDPQNHHWLVELTFADHLTPRHPALGPHLAHGPNLAEVRTATNGVTYCCPGTAVMSPDIELQMLRASITVPNAENIFRVAFDNCGYECKISDKGAYAQASIDKFGSLGKIGQALRHDGDVTILALDAMSAKSKGSFQFAPELEIRSKGSSKWEMEIDICCIASWRNRSDLSVRRRQRGTLRVQTPSKTPF